MSSLIAKKYKIHDCLGKGSFGSIYLAKNIRSQEWIALKSEPVSEFSLLKHETLMYQHVLHNLKGFPSLLWYGIQDKRYYMALQLLGPSLRSYATSFVSLFEIGHIGKQMVERVETLHNEGYLHRDIKPDNFLFESTKEDQHQTFSLLYLIDFGFSKRYLYEDGRHIEYREKQSIIGTPSFMSDRVKQGIEFSRRDDMESIYYIMMFLAKESNLLESSSNVSSSSLWFPFLQHCRSLQFEECPLYELLKNECQKV